jgi:hypothetical protein
MLVETPEILVFILEERGGIVKQKAKHELMSELFEKARPLPNANALVVNITAVNDRKYLLAQIEGKDISEWEMLFYYYGREKGPVLLNEEDKRKLSEVLASHSGTSFEAIFEMIDESQRAE